MIKIRFYNKETDTYFLEEELLPEQIKRIKEKMLKSLVEAIVD